MLTDKTQILDVTRQACVDESGMLGEQAAKLRGELGTKKIEKDGRRAIIRVVT